VNLLPRQAKGDLQKYLHKYFSYSVEGYKCDGCKDTAPKQRSHWIAHSPDVLCIQLKRFDPLGRKDKHPIPFTSSLDLNPFRTCNNKTNSTYELCAVVSHLGGTSGGHYRCIAKGEDNSWRTFDDAKMIRAKQSQALDPGNGKSWTPYLLFFQRETKVKPANTSASS
jgi:ubiquitin C-terminal hydrolase